ncbi:LysR family transcriptional regulator [Halioxenophilus sp. WMMB6]|uniref:LysR family transcriptional regulator n=1 Tax=Halioxenophilus sp. WMMB6 TaxID=3073815 RepID=UPI00295E7F39|nr:LysR family transcriptional regulator [Halioxenophilus sp. WMMB6]
MNHLEAIATFVEVVNCGSFSQAAERLSVSKSHVSRQISQLENHLDALLLNRTTRKVSLTDVGQSFYPTCREMLTSLREAEQAIIEQQHTVRGLLTVSVAGQFGEDYVVPATLKFMAKYPQVTVNLDFSNRLVDLVAEGYDLAIRAGRLKDSSLIARRIASRKLYICASPAYLEQHGQPEDLTQLRPHNCLVGTLNTWRFLDRGQHLDLRVEGNWRSNNGRALVLAALSGLGLVQLPSFYLEKHIQAGELVKVLEPYYPTDTGTWAVYPSNRHMSHKVRLFINFLAEEFTQLALPNPASGN